MANLKKMSDRDLAEYQAGWRPDTRQYILAEMEIQSRLQQPGSIRSWIAIAISVVALLVSIVALFVKR